MSILRPSCIRGRMRTAPALRGFTIIEVLIAIALLAAVVGTSFTFMTNLLNARERLTADAARQRSATLLIDRLEAAILTCIAGDAAHGAGVAGDSESISILTRGVAAHLAGEGLRDSRVLGDLQRIELRFDESAQMVEARLTAAAVLAPPADQSALSASDIEPEAAEEPFWPLGSFAVVRFRFHDGSQWLDSFDASQAGGLPTAVEVAIWFDPWPGSAPPEQSEEVEVESEPEFERAFDEDAFALRSEMELYFDVPPPDRVRVIAVPDPGPGDDESVEFSDDEEQEFGL